MATQIEIYQRMIDRGEFEFSSLHVGLPEEAYRMADKTLQQLRRRGLATFRRDRRKFIWSLTEDGQGFVASQISKATGGK